MPSLSASRTLLRRVMVGCLATLGLAASAGRAETNAFDLAGPSLRATVTRGGVALPLSQVPNLSPGDRIRIAAELPRDQAAHYHLVLVFLRGATNPPPKNWLIDAETWRPKKATIDTVVPGGAEQALVLLVPDTGGAIDAVVSAVRDRPGAFVRASQELNQAMLDRARLEAFLDHVRERDSTDPTRIAEVSPQLAQSLAVKLDTGCLLRQPETQAACLTQGTNAVVLADSQTSSIAQTLAGAPADIALQLSATPQGGYGYYSPYIGVVRDLARILGAFQSAQLQFIPALSVQQGVATKLLLNAVPSFRKPQSVLVAALPSVTGPTLPPLQARAEGALCIGRPGLVLPVSGAPLVFATDYARAMALRVTLKDGRVRDYPVSADPAQGGFVLAPAGVPGTDLDAAMTGTLHGLWGFQPFDGPRFRLAAPVGDWRVADGGTLVVGRDAPLTLDGGAAACVAGVSIRSGASERPVAWTARDDGRLALKVPLGDTRPGPVTILVRSYGRDEPQRLDLATYAEASGVTGFAIQAGDREGVLAGARLDQVASLDLGGIAFRPVALERTGAGDRLTVSTDSAGVGQLRPGEVRQAKVLLADGRSSGLKVTVGAARPAVRMLARSIERVGAPPALPIAIAVTEIVPQDARLVFSLKAAGGTRFAPGDAVDVAAVDGDATASVPLQLQDAHVAIASLVPAATLGAATYGAVRFRLVQGGVAGEWQPLATVVRVPTLTGLDCAAKASRCTLRGKDLFLLRAVSAGEAPAQRVAVPDGFTGPGLDIPRPEGGRLSLTLRDAPEAVATVTVAG